MNGVRSLKKEVRSSFKLTEFGETRYYVDISFKREENRILLHQMACFYRMVEGFGSDMTMSAPTPKVDNIDNLFKGEVLARRGKRTVEVFL